LGVEYFPFSAADSSGYLGLGHVHRLFDGQERLLVWADAAAAAWMGSTVISMIVDKEDGYWAKEAIL